MKKQELNEYGYEGLYDEKGVFKIKEQQKDIPRKSKKKYKGDDGKEENEEKEEKEEDTRKVNKGVKCVQSVPKKKLLVMIYTFKLKAPSDYKKRSRKNYDMDTIRGMYGSQKIKEEKEEKKYLQAN